MTSTDWQTSCSTIQDANLHLLKSKKFSDVVFLVGETKVEVHAHKLILMSRSSAFEAMFERWETDKKSHIEIPEISHKSFQLFLEYLYSNRFSVTEEDASEILYLAHKYCSNDLALLCSDLLKSDIIIQVGNVINIHQVASRLDRAALRTQAMDFILRNARSVFLNAGFLEIDSETLSTVLKDDNLVADELTVFRAVMRWAENRCKVEKLDNTIKNKRTILKDLIHLIRFHLMGTEDFTEEVVRKNKGILSDAETIGICTDLATKSSNNSWQYFLTLGPLRSNLSTTPFNRNRIRSPDIYRVEPYIDGTDYFEGSSCRSYKDTGSNYQCVSTIIPAFTGSDMWSDTTVTFEQFKTLLTHTSVKIEFDNEIFIPMDDKYELKLTFFGGADRTEGFVDARYPGTPRSSVKVICGSTSTTLSFFPETTECGLRSVLNYRGYTFYPLCLSSGQISAIYFTL